MSGSRLETRDFASRLKLAGPKMVRSLRSNWTRNDQPAVSDRLFLIGLPSEAQHAAARRQHEAIARERDGAVATEQRRVRAFEGHGRTGRPRARQRRTGGEGLTRQLERAVTDVAVGARRETAVGKRQNIQGALGNSLLRLACGLNRDQAPGAGELIARHSVRPAGD